jgi:N utilization substance protein A
MTKLSNQDHLTELSDPSREETSAFTSIGILAASDLAVLSANGIRSLDELADLASDELLELVGFTDMSRERADQIIMAARAHWFQRAS